MHPAIIPVMESSIHRFRNEAIKELNNVEEIVLVIETRRLLNRPEVLLADYEQNF